MTTKLIHLDENRARLVATNYMPSLILQLNDSSLIPFAIPVLYNICVDYGKFRTLGELLIALTSQNLLNRKLRIPL